MSRSDTASNTKRTNQRFSVHAVAWEHGSVVNMSGTGACLIDTRALSPMARGVTQTIEFNSEGHTLSLQVKVHWVRQSAAAGGMLAGVEFAQPSPEQVDAIEEFAKFGFSESVSTAERTADTFSEQASSEPSKSTSHTNTIGAYPRGEVVDLYQVLGVRTDANEAEIRIAFRREAARWHPDTCSSADAAARFVEITKAYSVLRDGANRGKYDSMLRQAEGLKAPAATSNTDRRNKGRLRCGGIKCSAGEILNASRGGLQVLAKKRMGQKQGKQIRLALNDGDQRLDLVATIAWVAEAERGKRRLGLRVELSSPHQQEMYWQFVRNASHAATSDFHRSSRAA